MNYTILIFGAVILVLDVYVMILDKKIKKLQKSIMDISKANTEALNYSKKLADVTTQVNDNAGTIIQYNAALAKINQEVLTNVKIITDTIKDSKKEISNG